MPDIAGGTVLYELDAEDSKLKGALSDVESQAQKSAKGVGSAFSKAIDGLEKSLGKIGANMSKYVTLPIVGAFTAGIKSSMDFEATMGNISTLIAGDSTSAINELGDAVKQMSKEFPKSPNELGAALYDVLSAGVQGTSQQMQVLESSTKLAVGGLADTKEGVNIMTSAINAFGLKAEDSNQIADTLFKTVKFGKTTVSQMAQAFGATAPVIAAAGIKLEEFSAATAALTTTGTPAAQAQNQLRAAVVALTKPTAEMTKLLKKAGLESGTAAMANLGLVETFNRLRKAANDNQTELAGAYGSVEALGAATALTGAVGDTFTQTLKDMTEGSNALDEATKKQNETTAAQYQIMKNQLNVAMIDLGTKILPIVIPLVDKLAGLFGQLVDWFNQLSPQQQDNILKWGLIAAAAGPVFSVLSNMLGLLKGAGGLISSFGTLALKMSGATGEATVLAKFLAATPWAITIGVGLAAVYAAYEAVKQLRGELTALEKSQDKVRQNQENLRDTLKAEVAAGRMSANEAAARLAKTVEFQKRALGGPVTAGMPYEVGEVGRELFIPETNGVIIPNRDLEGMGGQTNNITMNNVIRRETDFDSVARRLSFELAMR